MSQPHTGTARQERAQRTDLVLDALQDRTLFGRRTTGTPVPLQWAIAEFRLELRRTQRSVPTEHRVASRRS
jgi:hypothetical protein